MLIRSDIRKVMVIGSGPIIIGQAAEFDYAGTQACRSLKEEGMEVVLINSNPATIMTDTNMADRVYIEPLTPEFLSKLIEKEKPDGLLPTLGGQVGLNVIEVNPRVSRSSALASKATGYPIAKVASKIAIGLNLDEIKNAVTGKTYACFEPSIDYVVAKFPRWLFDKFALADRLLGTQMKATGEVMAIDRTIEGALLKSVRSLEIGLMGFFIPEFSEKSDHEIEQQMVNADDLRLFAVAEGLRRGVSKERIFELTKIDRFFLDKLKNIVNMEEQIRESCGKLSSELLQKAKKMGFGDAHIAQLTGLNEIKEVRELRRKNEIVPAYKMVDTCAAEFEAVTPYYYSSYDGFNEVQPSENRKVVVLGSGPIRIGQGIEFDYCSVHSVWALRQEGVEAIIINNNPETVSTDFDTADRLYFEPLVIEDVMNVLDKEKPEGVIVQFGGQTAVNLAAPLAGSGVKILGTSVNNIDRAEDRERFDNLLTQLNIPKPLGQTALSVEEADLTAARIGFPVLIRPSYVLGGRAMVIVYNRDELLNYMATAVKITPEHPVLVDKYLFGVELEVDAVSDGDTVLIPGIMRHVERAGVHSGDSIAVYPASEISPEIKEKIVDYTTRLAQALQVRGIINIQYVLHDGEVYVLEVNPRASRTVPYISKITGIPVVNLATRIILGRTLKELGYAGGLWKEGVLTGVKTPVFSFAKLTEVDISLGPEMKSTGEVMGIDRRYSVALYKSLVSAGYAIPQKGNVLASIADRDKKESLPILSTLAGLGYKLFATVGTAEFLRSSGMSVESVRKIREDSPNIVDLIRTGEIHLVISTLTRGREPERDGFRIRRMAVEHNIPCLTSLDTAWALVEVLRFFYFLLKPLWSGTDYPVASYANVPLLEHYDLIVAGAEPEGIAAAVSGARNGLKTLLVDVRPEVGGLMTRGWLSNIDMNYGPNKEILNKGIFLEFYEGVGGDAFDPAVASQVFNSIIAKEKNLQVFLNAADIQPLSVNNTMIGLRILPQKGDAREVKAWRVIDATCDADIAAAAGVPYSLGFSDCGRPGEYMATTLVFRLKGISSLDWMKLVLNLKLSEEPNNGVKNQSAWGFSQIMKRYQPTDNRLMVRGLNICRLKDNRVLVNALLVLGMDPLDYNSRKEGRILAEKEIPLLTKYISKNIPGLSSVMPDATAPELYIRQSRNIYGLYRLSINDVLENRDFKDRIAMGSYPVDIQATSQSFRGDVIGKPKLYSVPFRCLVPKEVNNLLVVGRSASFDSLSAGSTRVIPVGMATGQAAGAAAALSIEKGLPFNEMSGDLNVIHELQKRLNAQGMKLYSFSYEIPCGNHWAYPGLRFVRKWGMASGGYTNNYRLDEAMSVMSFINTLSRVTGTKIPTGVMIYPASEKLTLTNASQIICCFKNLSVPKPETLQYLKLAGFWEPDLLKHIQNEGKISKGAGYMIVLRYADWPGQTSINQGGQN